MDWYWLKEIWYAGSESDWLMLNPQSLGLWEKVIIHFAETYSAQLSFSDVSSSAYYYDAVKWAVANDITSGTDKTHFSPDAGCTRAQAVTFLWRAAGKPEPQSTTSAFIDVKAGSYYEKAVQWAVEQKIVSGTSATTFSPDTTCTRAQIVTFLWRKEGSPKVSGGSFSDVPEEAYYTDAVKWAVANGITRGTDKTHFSPNNKCTRGQIVSFLYRYGK
ncbi:MAG: S-layer homology domain-containing protein [Acutalibacter sp.]|nr:S-layer homology domain-containing protein [Acutalibacter sp.]